MQKTILGGLVMGDFGDAERRILAFMAEGTEVVFQEKNYKIILSG